MESHEKQVVAGTLQGSCQVQKLRVSAPLLGDELAPASSRLVHEVGMGSPQPMALSTCSDVCHGLAP